MRLLRVVLALLAPAVMLVTVSAPPAFACSCAYVNTASFVGGADEIFIGTLTSMTEPSHTGVVSSSDPITYTVEVDAVYRGEVGPVAEFESAMSGASCGLEGMAVDRRYLIFARTEAGRRTASSCSGTAPATPGLVKAVERLTGAGAPPVSTVDDMGSPTEAAAPSDSHGASQASSSPWAATMVTLAGIAAIFGAGLVLRRRGGLDAPRR